VDSLPLLSCYTQHTATHCNTLQHTATHCNTLHTHPYPSRWRGVDSLPLLSSWHVQIHTCVMTHSYVRHDSFCRWRGVDSLPLLSSWYRRQSAQVLTVRELCLHCLVYLCVGTSFPVITCTLGTLKRAPQICKRAVFALSSVPVCGH